jgi:hypothetical protein
MLLGRFLLVLLLWLGVAGIARADAGADAGACAQAHAPWRQRCSERTGVPLQVLRCPPGRVVLQAGSGPAAVPVEISPASERSFRTVGALGASPVGEFPDWLREPKERQDAFAAVVGCLGELSLRGEIQEAPLAPPRRPPWRLLGALLLLGGLGLASRRGLRPRWSLRRARLGLGPGGALALLALALVTLLGRFFLIPARFFHQNGQGPFWVEAAAHNDLSFHYGPGYPELFGWLAGAFLDAPERAVFGATALLGALVPPCGVLLALSSGASARVAWVVGLGMGLHPLLGRLARGESYLGVQVALLSLAAAALARGGRARGRSWVLAGAVVAAGLLVAQAARVHPTSWLAGAVLPLVLLAQPGSVTGRIKRTALATLGVGAVVLLTSGEALWGVYRGPLGQQWRPSSLVSVSVPWMPLLACAGLGWLLRRRPGVLLALGAGGAALAMLRSVDMLGLNFPWIADAYRLQFFPVVLASGVGVLSGLRWRWSWAPTAVTAVGMAALLGLRWREHSTIPTDAEEQAWAQRWRERVPRGASLVYLSRAEERIVMLPLARGRWRVHGVNIRQEPLLPQLYAGSFYYRSSLCATPEGRPACEALERGASLEAVEERELSAVASLPWLPLPGGPVRVGLYQVR